MHKSGVHRSLLRDATLNLSWGAEHWLAPSALLVVDHPSRGAGCSRAVIGTSLGMSGVDRWRLPLSHQDVLDRAAPRNPGNWCPLERFSIYGRPYLVRVQVPPPQSAVSLICSMQVFSHMDPLSCHHVVKLDLYRCHRVAGLVSAFDIVWHRSLPLASSGEVDLDQ